MPALAGIGEKRIVAGMKQMPWNNYWYLFKLYMIETFIHQLLNVIEKGSKGGHWNCTCLWSDQKTCQRVMLH